jgi:tetratricopeptide (TPR) repeat protein
VVGSAHPTIAEPTFGSGLWSDCWKHNGVVGSAHPTTGRYTEALAECEIAIQQDPKHESGYYAKACYYALHGELEQVIENLQKAIEIAPRRSRQEAKRNPDFDGIRNNEQFRALVYPQLT